MSARKNKVGAMSDSYPKTEEQWAEQMKKQKWTRDFLAKEKVKAAKLFSVTEAKVDDNSKGYGTIIRRVWYGKGVDGSLPFVKKFFKHDNLNDQTEIFKQVRACDFIPARKHNQSFSFTVQLDVKKLEKQAKLEKMREYEWVSSSESSRDDAVGEARAFEVKKPTTVIADRSGEDGLFFRFLSDASIGRFQKTDGVEHHVPWNSFERDVERAKFFDYANDVMKVSEMEARQASSSSSMQPLNKAFDNTALITVVKLLAESLTNLIMETKQRYSMVDISLEFALFTDDVYLKKRRADQKDYIWRLEEMQDENNKCLHQLEAGVCKNTGHLLGGAGDFSSCYKYHLDLETNVLDVTQSDDGNAWVGSTHVAKMCRMTRTLIGQRVLQRKSRFESYISIYEEYLDNLETMLRGEFGIKLNDQLEPIRVNSKKRGEFWPKLLPTSKYESVVLTDSSSDEEVN